MQPPHTRDLLFHEDGNYRSQVCVIVDEEAVQDSDPITEDPMDIAEQMEATENSSDQTSPARRRTSSPTTSGARLGVRNNVPSSRGCPPLPNGVTPVLISSSDASKCSGGHKLGNRAVRRKSLSGHTLIAQATRASSDIMAGQMKEMADASQELERSKIEV